jgi:hypothetical protein
MKKIIAWFRVVTFLNLEIIGISVLLVILSIFGFKYINSTIFENGVLKERIINNEKSLLAVYKITNNMSRIDDEILSNCLNVNTKYDSLSHDINTLIYQKNLLKVDKKTSIILDSLIKEKIIMYNKIDNFIAKRVKVSDISNSKEINIVSKNVEKGIFKNKTKYTNHVKKYDEVNNVLFTKEYSKVLLINSNNRNSLIKSNNDLSLNIRNVLDEYSNNKFESNIIQYENISNEIEGNLNRYTVIVLILTILYAFLVSSLLKDLNTKSKISERDKSNITMLIDNYESNSKS